jgi:hypothetical protein
LPVIFRHELVAHGFGDLEHLGAVGVAHHLHQAFAVAQVDEDDAAVVAATVHPAAKVTIWSRSAALTFPQ